MASGSGESGGGFTPEVLAGFGGFPPSLLAPYFSFRRVVPYTLPSAGSIPQLTGNVNRWAIIICSNNTGEMFVCPDQFVSQVEPIMAVHDQQFAVLTFAEIGSLICQPFWVYSSAPPVGTCHEVIYTPRRC